MKNIITGNSKYGFFDAIPSDKIRKINKIDISHYEWLVTSDFKNAKNHCAATTSTNLDIFFNKINYFSKQDIFDIHHSLIGNGPIIGFSKKTKTIINKYHNVESNMILIDKVNKIKKAVDNNKISTLLLSEALFNWHWVICVGYIELLDDSVIFIIIDNWNRFTRYYKPNKGSLFVSGNIYY